MRRCIMKSLLLSLPLKPSAPRSCCCSRRRRKLRQHHHVLLMIFLLLLFISSSSSYIDSNIFVTSLLTSTTTTTTITTRRRRKSTITAVQQFLQKSVGDGSNTQPQQQNLQLPPIQKQLPSIPLLIKLAGGLILQAVSSNTSSRSDKILIDKLLDKSIKVINNNPLIGMELGTGLEAGIVFCSTSSMDDVDVGLTSQPSDSDDKTTKTNKCHQIIMEFQLNGGNSWAQCYVHGYQLVSRETMTTTKEKKKKNIDKNNGSSSMGSVDTGAGGGDGGSVVSNEEITIGDDVDVEEDDDDNNIINIVSLRVSNMDAAFNGGWVDII